MEKTFPNFALEFGYLFPPEPEEKKRRKRWTKFSSLPPLSREKKNRKNVQRNVNLLRSNYEVNAHLWRLQWVEFSGLSPPPLSCLDEAM